MHGEVVHAHDVSPASYLTSLSNRQVNFRLDFDGAPVDPSDLRVEVLGPGSRTSRVNMRPDDAGITCSFTPEVMGQHQVRRTPGEGEMVIIECNSKERQSIIRRKALHECKRMK